MSKNVKDTSQSVSYKYFYNLCKSLSCIGIREAVYKLKEVKNLYEEDMTLLENMITNANGLKKETEKELIQLVGKVLSKDYSMLNEKEKTRVKFEVRKLIKEIQAHISQLEQKYSPDIAVQIERELIFVIDRAHS